MRLGSMRISVTQIGVLALSALLLSCAPAFADTTATPSPTSTPSPKAAAAKKTSTTTPKSAASGSSSAIATPVDPTTQAFRDQLAARQAELEAFKTELTGLDNELEIASQQYNAASDQLAALNARLKAAQVDMEAAQKSYDLQSQILGERATSIYKNGALSGVQVLLDSKSVDDLISRIKFLNTVGIADASVANSLKAQREQMQAQLLDLKNAQEQAASIEFEMKARKIEVELRISDRQATMAAAQSDLLTMLNGEATRRSSQETALFQQTLSGASKAGIVVAAGSPVETALAYHGVPYLWGGATPAGFDCSGLMMYVFAQHGVLLPHYSGSQFQLGEKIDLSAIQPNDVIFFGNPVHHVGMYAGGGYFIEAPFTGSYVRISKLDTRNDIAGVRRYLWVPRVGDPLNAVTSVSSALKSVN